MEWTHQSGCSTEWLYSVAAKEKALLGRWPRHRALARQKLGEERSSFLTCQWKRTVTACWGVVRLIIVRTHLYASGVEKYNNSQRTRLNTVSRDVAHECTKLGNEACSFASFEQDGWRRWNIKTNWIRNVVRVTLQYSYSSSNSMPNICSSGRNIGQSGRTTRCRERQEPMNRKNLSHAWLLLRHSHRMRSYQWYVQLWESRAVCESIGRRTCEEWTLSKDS